jgi:uncharacterized protein (TIGR03435 family)
MKKLSAVFLAVVVLFAQSEKKKLAFDVVSIKPNNSGDNRRMIVTPPGGRFNTTNIPLRQLIVFAYGDRVNGLPLNMEISGLPGWATSDGFDVQAQPEAGFTPTPQQTQEMMQSMLEDRFKLKLRRETKDVPIFALVVGKDGVKMKLAENQTPFDPTGPPLGGPPATAPPSPGPGPMQMPGPIGHGTIMNGLGQLRAGAQPMAMLAGLFTSLAGRKVIDKTGLTGLYDIDLKWTPDQLPNGAPMPPEIDATGPAFSTAIQEQLGLRLVPETGKVDVFVIESVQRPSEN